jgi:multiple sugar transport system substrate-binding protein
MSSISKNRQAAFEVMAFISGEKFQNSLNSRGLATVLKDTKLHEKYGQDLPLYKGVNVKALFPVNPAKMFNVTRYQTIAAGELVKAITAVTSGTDINTALRTATEAVNTRIQTDEAAKK